jgi:two-component system LytT family sensor kinase
MTDEIMPSTDPARARSYRRLLPVAIIIAAWLFVAIAWTPPTYLLQQMNGTSLSWTHSFVFVLAGFLPWIAITPLVLWLGRRFPVTEGHAMRQLGIQACAGALLLPLVTFGGEVAARIVIGARGSPFSFIALRATIIVACYGVPTYIAVAGIAQALAYFERYRARERLLAHAELRALQAQLNPHFLFNTLNAISAIGYRDPELADRALTHLSQLLRTTLDQGEGEAEIALDEEIEFARDFLELYAIIMPGRLRVTWQLEPGVGEVLVPRMLLQPLIENALVHGITRLPRGGSMSLAARQSEACMHLVIRNDVPRLPTEASGAGVGLANVRERLRVIYGTEAELRFERDDTRAEATITLPGRRIQR